MASNSVKFIRAENKRLQSLVAKLTGTIETTHLQLMQKESDLAKRRIEVATLHEAFRLFQRSPAVSSSISSFTIPLGAIPGEIVANDSGCMRCEKAKDTFGELRVAIDAFAEKLQTAFSAKEAQFEEKLNTALKEKDGEIEKLAAALAKRKRKDQERRQRAERQRAENEETMRQMEEMKAQQDRMLEQHRIEMEERKLQDQRKTAQELREIEEEHVRRVHTIHQRAVVQSRQRRGVADAA